MLALSFVAGYFLLGRSVVHMSIRKGKKLDKNADGVLSRMPANLCWNVAHRGGASEATENTMEAFAAAQRHGCQMLELDVQLTKDGHCIVFHDDNLLRASATCDPRTICEIDYQELQTIRLRHRPQNMFELSVPAKDEPATQTIPLLTDVLTTFGHRMALHIDVKAGGPALIREVDRLIRAHRVEDSVVWGSPLEHQRQALKAQNPKIKTFASKRGIITTITLWYLGVLPFVPPQWAGSADYFSVVFPTKAMHHRVLKFVAGPDPGAGRQQLAAAVAAGASWLLHTPLLYSYLEGQGVRVLLWVVNDEEDWRLAAAEQHRRASGVMTDRPAAFQEWLQQDREKAKAA